MRLIPGKTKVRVELFKGISITDLIIGGLSALLILLIVTSTIPGKLYIAIGFALIAVGLLARLDEEPNYLYLLHILRHFGYRRHYEKTFTDADILRMQGDERDEVAFEGIFEEDAEKPEETETKEERKERLAAEKAERKADDKILKSKTATKEEKDAIWLKRANQSAEKKKAKASAKAKKDTDNAAGMADIMAFTDIHDDMIDYAGKYYGVAIEIPPVEFRFFSQNRRNNSIENGIGRILRSVPADYSVNIVKIERPIIYDSYIENEYKKLDDLRTSYEQGMISEEELQSRVEILFDRINDLRNLCYEQKILQPFYYIVLFDSDRQQLRNSVRSALDSMRGGELKPHRLNDKELAVFLKYTNEIDFDERDIEKIEPADYAAWAMPQSLHFKARTISVNNIITHNLRLVNYPTIVGDAWLASVLSMPATKVVIKCTPMDRTKSIRGIDRSLQELRGQWSNTGVDSKRIELQEHIETLGELLSTLQSDNETLLEVNTYVTAYDINLTRETPGQIQPPPSALTRVSNMKRAVKRTYQEYKFRLSGMDFDQVNAFIGAQVSAWDPMRGKGRGIPSNTIAAAYPWIFAHVSDPNGIKLGSEDGVPVFIDFFRRDSERVNSNMVIVGKSGSGKSYATKSLLANLAADDAKIFILDPENEYSELAENLHGKFINVGNAQFGRLNPFHIITALDDDEEGSSTVSGSYATHLQFLEEFFKQILPDCDRDAMEYLNSLVDQTYSRKDITAETDLSKLRPEDYPTFDDLYDAILTEFQATDNDYIRTMLRTLLNYVEKFATGGRNANIWNGPSTVTTDENFTVFNFQSLLANRNATIANAQMLLVLKYIDNEIIKNRDYNTKYHRKRKVVVVIDEAHVFIDTKFPVALDFMFQLAKRIRKYNGMQIVITQNIKDFVGSEEIARKSTAIINACQYSFIFSLAPNDMSDLCKLYEKAGGINENEQEQIVQAGRGQAFTVMSPTSRSSFKVEVPEDIVAMFRERDFVSGYFAGEAGEADWQGFLGDSKEKREALLAAKKTVEEVIEDNQTKKKVTLIEVDKDEIAAFTAIEPKKKQSSVMQEEKEDEFPDIPEDLEEFVAMRRAAQPDIPAPQGVAPGVEQMVAQLGQAVENMSRLSYESMMREMQRMIEENNANQAQVRGISEDIAETSENREEDDFNLDLSFRNIEEDGETVENTDNDDIFDFDINLDELLSTESESDESTSLGSIFNKDALREAARLNEEESRAYDDYDEEDEGEDGDEDDHIMEMLLAAAKETDEQYSRLESMEKYDELTLRITLQDLIQYNARAH